MAFPSSIQFLGMRLRPLAKPVVWCPTLVIIVLGVFLWEYRTHPEWSGEFQVDESTPNAGTLLPEGEVILDQPVAAGGDSERTGFMGLLADLGLLGPEAQSDDLGVVPQIQQETPESLLDLLISPETLADSEDGNTAPNRQRLAGTRNPFARYADDYQLPGSAGAIANGGISPSSSGGNGFGDFLNFLTFNQTPGDAPATQTVDNNSGTTPLERALNQRQEPEATASDDTAQSAESANTAESSLNAQGNPQNPAVVPGNIPGVPYTFIQTTPQMSPPPGTTGYTAPPSLNFSQPQVPTAGAGAVPTPSFQPSLPSGTSGSTLPPTNGSQYNQPQVVNPLPFSAPRPNGRYIGNGQIETFSNPLGSSAWDPTTE